MKVKHHQLFDNDCGECAIKNLLSIYGIEFINVKLNYSSKGISPFQIKKCLLNYFENVEVVSFSTSEIKKVKKFKPYITLISNNEIGHYVMVYKKSKKYIYVIDSLFKNSYKIKYDDFIKIEKEISIVVDKPIQIKLNKNIKHKTILFSLAFIESIFWLSSTILLQQIIDNGISDAIIFILIECMALLFTRYKIYLFLKNFKEIDKNVICNSLTKVYKLKYSYVKKHNIDEIYYRFFDAYSYKSMILSYNFTMISDIVLCVCSVVLMFIYSYIITLFILLLCIIIFIYTLFVFKKNENIVEEKRIKEYEFINSYRDSFKNVEDIYMNKNKSYYHNSLDKLLKYQKIDYGYEKLNMIKNYNLMVFQTIIITLVIILYFTSFYNYITIGSLVALINLVSLTLQPILNICSQISMYSNMRLIKQRLNDLNENT